MMKVTVEQRRCVGNGCCAAIAPEVFVMGDDAVAYVCQDGRVFPQNGTALVPIHLEPAVLEAVDECPAECVRVELVA
ncbi:MAG TPA: ferredoxin [Acidimicrobiia bacterium]